MKSIKIKYACAKDAKDILDINILSWKTTYKDIFPSEFLNNLCKREEDYKKSLEIITNDILTNNSYIVAIHDNKVVGFANFGKSKKENYKNFGEIYALYLESSYVYKGIGTKLFRYAVNELHKKYRQVIVSCIKENSANDFYLKVGCSKIDETDFILNDKTYIENLYEYNKNE